MTKMKRTIAVMVAAAGLVLSASAASALPSISLVWQDTGSPTIGTGTTPSVAPSSLITANVVVTGDSSGITLTAVFISFLFDAATLLVNAAATRIGAIASIDKTSAHAS